MPAHLCVILHAIYQSMHFLLSTQPPLQLTQYLLLCTLQEDKREEVKEWVLAVSMDQKVKSLYLKKLNKFVFFLFTYLVLRFLKE